MVYVGSDDRNLYAIDRQSGDVLWKYETAGFVGTSPFVVDGVIYFGSYDGSVYAVR